MRIKVCMYYMFPFSLCFIFFLPFLFSSWYEMLIEYPEINKENEKQKKKKRGIFPMTGSKVNAFKLCCLDHV